MLRLFIFQLSLRRLAIACALMALAAGATPLRAADADPKKLIEDLKKDLEKGIPSFRKDFTSDPGLKAKLDELAKTLQTLDCVMFAELAIDCNISRVTNAISELNIAVTNSTVSGETQKANILKAINAMIDISENDPAANKPDSAGKIDPAGNKPDPNAAATLIVDLLNTRLQTSKADPKVGELKKSIATLMKILGVSPTPKKPVINIYRAFYGDLDLINKYIDLTHLPEQSTGSKSPQASKWRTPNLVGEQVEIPLDIENIIYDSKRVCSATQSMRAYCQGKASCWTSTDTASTSRSGNNLCGYEPAPYAEPITKGLVVYYSCVTEVDLTKDPPDPTGTTVATFRRTQFRMGEAAQIICSEADPKAGAGQ